MADKNLGERGAENNVEGMGNKIKGHLKDAAGGLTGDSSLQAEGKWDKTKGKVQDALGDAQRAVHRETKGPDRP